MPDPKDPSRIVTTTTTTTFSMAKDMARSICQRFVEARFIESADGKYQQLYNMKGSVWQLTPKGVTVLDRFCARNGIQQKQVAELSNMNAAHLVILERDQLSDKLLNDLGTIEVIFRRFVGTESRNVKSTATAADSDSLHDYKDGLTGVKMAAERKINGRMYRDTFTGRAATDWLMDCSTIVDRRETVEIATLFVEYGLVETVTPDRAFMAQNTGFNLFQPTKHAIYQLSRRGKDLINGNGARGRASESEGGAACQRNGISRDSNTQRLEKILNDPALRLLFRENLRETHCEENLSFYQDVTEFVRGCKAAIRQAQKSLTATSMDTIKEIMAQAYGIYNAFLAPGSPCELNIDHQLRNNLATRMTKAVGQDNSMIETLQEVAALFEDARTAVFKLMASVRARPGRRRRDRTLTRGPTGLGAQVSPQRQVRAAAPEPRPRHQRTSSREKPEPLEPQVAPGGLGQRTMRRGRRRVPPGRARPRVDDTTTWRYFAFPRSTRDALDFTTIPLHYPVLLRLFLLPRPRPR